MNDNLEIQLSKTKILLQLIVAAAFVVFGAYFILNPEKFLSSVFRNSEIIRITGIASVAFFGLCLIFITRKLLDSKVGLMIDEHGITDNTNATSVGLIEWADITNIETVKVASTKFLMLETDKPNKYIERAKNGLSERALRANYRMYGSPLSIISNSIKIKHDDLEKLIREELERRKVK